MKTKYGPEHREGEHGSEEGQKIITYEDELLTVVGIMEHKGDGLLSVSMIRSAMLVYDMLGEDNKNLSFVVSELRKRGVEVHER